MMIQDNRAPNHTMGGNMIELSVQHTRGWGMAFLTVSLSHGSRLVLSFVCHQSAA